MSDGPRCDAASDEFVTLYVADRDEGRLRDEADYLRLYPGCEDVISREWRRLEALFAGEDSPPDEAAPPRAPSRPAELGRYRIERELGRGAQGTVFLALDTHVGRRVALKVLKTSWSGSEAMVKRFGLEAQALARFDHPGIVAIHDAGSAHGLEYFAMRYVEGRTLARELADQALGKGAPPASWASTLRYVGIIEKCARALHVAHESGLVHRDVKPSNIMITAGDEPVLLDFGLARFLDSIDGKLTGTGEILGTPDFMAPEQIAGDRARIDRRTDVYALAATLRALVAEADGDARRSSRNLEAVLETATDPVPDRRYATAAAFAEDLARVRRGEPVSVRPAGPVRKLVTWIRRAPAAAALAILSPAVLVAGLVALAIKNGEIEAAARALAAREAEADDAARRAGERFAAFQRLDDLRRLDELERRERGLWPLDPATAPALERWVADAGDVLARLPGHRAALEELRARGTRAAIREPGLDPVVDELLHAERVLGAARAEVSGPATPGERRARVDVVAKKAAVRVATLEAAAASRPSWKFAGAPDQWLHDNLSRLVARLEAMDAPSAYGATRAAIRKRGELARAVEQQSLIGSDAAWRDAIAAIANPATDPLYAGLKLDPIFGLVPLGRDPESRLWEFAHVASGTPPSRDAAGKLTIGEETSIVLVLVPGGAALMGTRRPLDDEEPRDHSDPDASPLEWPLHEVRLAPYFLSKYEVTQGQWLRLAGSNPAHGRPNRAWEGRRPDLRHPVEQVSLEDCAELLWRYGLSVPTEAQWEMAARAGTTTPWWTGETIASLLRVENLADLTLVRTEHVFIPHDPERDDGWAGAAPVGTYPANPFGFHDVIGNVAEWCADRIEFYKIPPLPGDGLRASGLIDTFAVRGGAFSGKARGGRSSARYGMNLASRVGTIGIRPARTLRRDP